jgi:SAM-dependent methyltransferase
MARYSALRSGVPLTRDQISLLAHAHHPIACPFDDARVASLLSLVATRPGDRILDVGCGLGEWLARLLADRPEVETVGVDTSSAALDLARRRLDATRASLHEQDARAFLATEAPTYDGVLCNGSTHALGGLASSLSALGTVLAPGGRLLISDGYWERPPTAAALRALGCDPDAHLSLDDTVQLAKASGYAVVHVATSSQQEWDHYEDAWCRGLEAHAASDSALSSADRATLVRTACSHREAYREGYRGTLGFVALVLDNT